MTPEISAITLTINNKAVRYTIMFLVIFMLIIVLYSFLVGMRNDSLSKIFTVEAEITSVAVSSDGERVVAGGRDGILYVWQERGTPAEFILEGHTCSITDIYINEQNNFIVSGSDNGEVFLWDIRNGLLPTVLRSADTLPTGLTSDKCLEDDEATADTRGITSVAITPSGQYAVAGSRNGLISVFDLDSARLLYEINTYSNGPNGPIWDVAAIDDQTLAANGEGNAVQVWLLATGTLIDTIGETNTRRPIYGFAVAPDRSKMVLKRGFRNVVEHWLLNETQAREVEIMKTGVLEYRTFTEDGSLLIMSGNYRMDILGGIPFVGMPDPTIYAIRTEDGSTYKTFKGHSGFVTDAYVSTNNKWLVSSSLDNTVRLWRLSN